jgi:hypothetical protein
MVEVQVANHLQHKIDIRGIPRPLEDIKQLAPPQHESITKNRVIGDTRREVVELRPRAWVVLRAHDDRDGWRIEMEQRVDADRGRNETLVCLAPPSEPDLRISRIRLSS